MNPSRISATTSWFPILAGWPSQAPDELDWDLAYFEVTPQWVCKVLPPSTARRDRILKLDIYHANRIDWAWLVDAPANATLIAPQALSQGTVAS